MLARLEERLGLVAQNTAKEFGFDFAPDCESLLHNMIRNGAQQMQNQKVAELEDKIREAENNLARFVTVMIKEAKKRGLPRLHEPTFHATFNELCPIWPFC